jgi:hypothetical protein
LIDEMISPKTLIRYLDDPSLTDLLRTLIRESASPLANVEDRFAVDSSGFSYWNTPRRETKAEIEAKAAAKKKAGKKRTK